MNDRAGETWRDVAVWWSVPVAIVLALGTFIYLGPSADAAAWACAQAVLVVLSGYDIASRRLPNMITLPTAAAALILRAIFNRSDLGQVAIAGVVSFVVFFVLAVALRGALGMGDVKLVGMLGFLLGWSVLPALVVGIFLGGLWAIALILARRVTIRSTIAYGPFLAAGGMLAILFTTPPPLV
jgi:leader peptidase (prepilin peptidase) / N-methyltransferase